MFDTVNWPDVLAGFILGLVPLGVRQLQIVLKYRMLPVRKKYVGRFWAYHRSTMGTGEVRERQIEIRHSFLSGRLDVRSVSEPKDDTVEHRLRYSGNLSRRHGMVRYFTLDDIETYERLNWHVIDPFYHPFDVTVGIYLCLDLRGLPAAVPMALSRRRLSSEEAENHLDDNVIRIEPVVEPLIDGPDAPRGKEDGSTNGG